MAGEELEVGADRVEGNDALGGAPLNRRRRSSEYALTVALDEQRARKPTTAAAAREIGTGSGMVSLIVDSPLTLDSARPRSMFTHRSGPP